jgi:hypothetical protein
LRPGVTTTWRAARASGGHLSKALVGVKWLGACQVVGMVKAGACACACRWCVWQR